MKLDTTTPARVVVLFYGASERYFLPMKTLRPPMMYNPG